MQDLQIKILDDGKIMGSHVVFYREASNEEIQIYNFFNNESEVIGRLDEIPEEYKMYIREPDVFFKKLAEVLDNRGVKTESDHKIEGLLEAKDNHLQDMRKLVFNNNQNE